MSEVEQHKKKGVQVDDEVGRIPYDLLYNLKPVGKPPFDTVLAPCGTYVTRDADGKIVAMYREGKQKESK